MRTPRETSPFGLIQEEMRDEPWKLLVCCTLLNMTSIKQVRPIVPMLFKRYPTHVECGRADPNDIAQLIKPLGLYNRRARTIVKLSQQFTPDVKDVRNLPGVGKYAADSWKIFIDGSLDVVPSDAKLVKYMEWARTHTQHQ